ncbi:MAG TPA: dihydroorotate dehydrogenase-like protein [Ilumatobacter sp.]|nr:dihydroorotate dehydrogenase-like protein [Ilumatobacter sp.]
MQHVRGRVMNTAAHTVDLSAAYLGMQLTSPIVASSSPVTGDPRMWDRLERAGAGAIVLPSLFEEQIARENLAFEAAINAASAADNPGGSSLATRFDSGPAHHISLVEQARAQLSIPVIASINGVTPGGWVHYARHLAEAGADAIELNLYDVVADHREGAKDVERRYVELVAEVRAQVSVPLAVKIGPSFTALANFAIELERAGADGLVLFNRLYETEIDVDSLTVVPNLVLSAPATTSPALHWIGIIRGCEEYIGSLAGTTGVHTGMDALKLLLAGANVAMTASAVMLHGPEVITSMNESIRAWMQTHDYTSVQQLRGSMSRRNVADPGVYERLNYYQTLHSWAATG